MPSDSDFGALKRVVIVGGGPAGLMCAEKLLDTGYEVHLYEAKPSVGRKFLIAGKGGMNLTHSEAFDCFVSRYGDRSENMRPILSVFGADQLRQWAKSLGFDTFVGSSGRVFPEDMKAAPLLRTWVKKLRTGGIKFHTNTRWKGWSDLDGAKKRALFSGPDGDESISFDAMVLAVGGGSWAKLGADGQWVPILREKQVAVNPLKPSNCGFNIDWSELFSSSFAGHPVKNVAIKVAENSLRKGEFVISDYGVEGSLIYALSRFIRNELDGEAPTTTLYLDMLPDKSLEEVTQLLVQPRGKKSLSSVLKNRLKIQGVKAALLKECTPKSVYSDMTLLANALKQLPISVAGVRPIDEAISSAGGVSFNALNDHLMVEANPGIFCAGEMLDWEAPTGGYLFTGCFSTGSLCAAGVTRYLSDQESVDSAPT